MKEEEKQQVYQYLQNYIHQKQEHGNYIDYYELCNLNEKMTIEQLKSEMKKKKLVKLFHPDQESILDPDFQEIFKECVQEIQDMQYVFSDERLKNRYDNELTKQKEINKNVSNRTVDEKAEEKSISFTKEEENYLERAIETTIYKYGFYQGYIALQKAVRNDFSSVTNDNHSRKLLKEMGVQKIRNIIESKQHDIMDTSSNNMVMNYYSSMIDKTGLKEKADIFYNACFETAKKYDLNSNDINQTAYAITHYIEDLNMEAFTNKNVDKQELCKMSPQDIQMLMMMKMHIKGKENSEYLFDNFCKKSTEEQIKLFSKEIKKEARMMEQQKKSI